mmetsp:Transcript_24526/g.30824  ORF Transcript_24526/g.30824 Transcript_24526/m.30824 type:complete len:97 (-) Transcript_24526:297-587(-)
MLPTSCACDEWSDTGIEIECDFELVCGGHKNSKKNCSTPSGGTTKLPKHMEPNDFVIEMMKCSLKTLVQHEVKESGLAHHVPTTPATVTWTIFIIT